MAKGNWSFLHEWVIYDYLQARQQSKTLRLKQVVSAGDSLGRTKWVYVKDLLPIVNTSFPDIDGIKLQGANIIRPAEVKFTTALFNYHKDNSYMEEYDEFIKNKGFLIVAAHDYLPKDFPDIDVFEIEIDDFISFCRENFARLLNNQIKKHTETKVWILYQGPNFKEGIDDIKPARDSKIWCPTENLTGFDLTKGDRILFIKTKGIGRIQLQNRFLREGIVDNKWVLEELYIAEVTSKIFSRKEYCQYKRYPFSKQFWKNDPRTNEKWRWNRVFEFAPVKSISVPINMSELHQFEKSKNFVNKSWEAFCYGKSRELGLSDYRNLLEVLT